MRRAPSAIASATSSLTAPLLSISAGHAEELGLGLVGVGDEAAVEDGRGAGDLGQARRRPARRCRTPRWRSSGPRFRCKASMISRRAAGAARGRSCSRSEGQADGCRGMGGDAFAAADEAEAFVGRRLHADRGRRRCRRSRRCAARMRIAMRPDLRPLATIVDVEMRRCGRRARDTRRTASARKRSDDAPFHCGSEGGKCSPISPSPIVAEQRVGQRVQPDIGVGMADQAALVRDLDAAQPDDAARRRRHARRSRGRPGCRRAASIASASEAPVRGIEIRGRGELHVARFARTTLTGMPASSATAASSVKSRAAWPRPSLRRRGSARTRKPCGVSGRESLARHGRGDPSGRVDRFSVSVTGGPGRPRPHVAAGRDHALDHVARHERPRRVVDEHEVRGLARKRLQAVVHRLLACPPPVTGGSSRVMSARQSS